ncbi:MAG: aspartate kinase [Eubacteriales bacterium]|nr:aspartate kinase [Eubacteriales bacterium]MDD4078400.1 aspartate kinase [Eubacteriales bacterium]MDD4768643.1 aspartate kinase [Eubacteriales bacterium]
MKSQVVVHKYGGTTLKDPRQLRNCGENICREYKSGKRPVVVVSAMGRNGDPYATDTFIGLAYAISPAPAARELDLLMACGELVSATLLAVQLQELGCAAMALTGSQVGIITDENHGNAEIQAVEIKRIRQVLEAGIIPVICGFQGVTASGELTTLGRGGSDITAVAMAAALKLDSATIYTDVPAIKTADPKLVKGARPIYQLHYQEILEMAVEGAKVIHPRAVERAMADDIRLVITSLTNGSTAPTEIGPRHSTGKGEGIIRAITHITGINQYKFDLEPAKMAELLDEIATAGINLDLINLADTGHSFTVANTDTKIIDKILENRKIEAQRREDCSKISLIGVGIRGVSGLMNRIYKPLTAGTIPVYHTSDSYTQIALLVPQARLSEAVNCLHQVFFGEDDMS